MITRYMRLPVPSLRVIGFLLIACAITPTQAQNTSTFSAAFITEQLERAKQDPDNHVEFNSARSLPRSFTALLAELPLYSDQVSSLFFDHRDSNIEGDLGIGSRRVSKTKNGETVVQKIIEFDAPSSFAYFTDMSESTISAPIDFSIGYYRFSETADGGTIVQVSTVYRPSSRLTAFLVRLGFNRAFKNDFRKAEEYLDSLAD